LPPKKIGLATLLLVTAFIQKACILLAHSHVSQKACIFLAHSHAYQAFHTACTFLLCVQSSTGKKLATTQDRQIMQNPDAKQYYHSHWWRRRGCNRTPTSFELVKIRGKFAKSWAKHVQTFAQLLNIRLFYKIGNQKFGQT